MTLINAVIYFHIMLWRGVQLDFNWLEITNVTFNECRHLPIRNYYSVNETNTVRYFCLIFLLKLERKCSSNRGQLLKNSNV